MLRYVLLMAIAPEAAYRGPEPVAYGVEGILLHGRARRALDAGDGAHWPLPCLPMGRMSNRDRIARAAEEARLAAEEKAAKRATKKKPATPSARSAKPVRMKVVWEVRGGSGKAIKTFPYAEKAAGEAEAMALTRSTGHAHTLVATKVPMD